MTRYPHGWRCVRAFPLHHRKGRLVLRRRNPPACMKETR